MRPQPSRWRRTDDASSAIISAPPRASTSSCGNAVSPPALAAAGWAVLRTEAKEAAGFACVADGVTVVLPNDGTSPLDACRGQWEAGAMVRGVNEAPPLAACVNDSSSVVVIPAEVTGACEAANMGTWTGQAKYHTVGAAIRSALVSFHDRYKAIAHLALRNSRPLWDHPDSASICA